MDNSGTHPRFSYGFTHEKDSQALILMPGWLYPRGRGLQSRRRFRSTVCPVRKVSIDGANVGDVCYCGVLMEWHRQAADPVPVPLWPPGERTKVCLSTVLPSYRRIADVSVQCLWEQSRPGVLGVHLSQAPAVLTFEMLRCHMQAVHWHPSEP